MSGRIPDQYERSDNPSSGYQENITRKAEEFLGRTSGRDTQGQESTTQRGMGMGSGRDEPGSRGVGMGSGGDEYGSRGMGMGSGGDEYGSRDVGGMGEGLSSGRRGEGTGMRDEPGSRGLGGEGGLGEQRGLEDEFISSRDPMMGKQRDVGDTYGSRSARDETRRTEGAMGGPPGTAGLGAEREQESMGGGRQSHQTSGLAGGVPGEDIGDDPMMTGRDQSGNTAAGTGTGLGGVSGLDSGKRDDGAYGGSYAGSGQPREKRDSVTGKILEKAGGILGSSKMEEKGHIKREARQRGE